MPPSGITLFAAACVQVNNLVLDTADGLDLSTCANETCGKRFVRQRGTAKAGQFRTKGVLYCSARCANTQGQREKRARARSLRTEA